MNLCYAKTNKLGLTCVSVDIPCGSPWGSEAPRRKTTSAGECSWWSPSGRCTARRPLPRCPRRVGRRRSLPRGPNSSEPDFCFPLCNVPDWISRTSTNHHNASQKSVNSGGLQTDVKSKNSSSSSNVCCLSGTAATVTRVSDDRLPTYSHFLQSVFL